MEISVGMIVKDAGKRDKYKYVIEAILNKELHRGDISFYSTLNGLYECVTNENKKFNILIIPAGQQSFKVAKEIRIRDRDCIILFPAQNMDFVLDAFESMPMAYVLPKTAPAQADLTTAIHKAVKYIDKQTQDITFETKSKLLHYSLHEIDYFESQYRIVHIIKSNGSAETVTARLDDVQALLPRNFARCHQSFLVNMDNIETVDKTNKEINFYSGQCVPSSKKLFALFTEEYMSYKNGGEL